MPIEILMPALSPTMKEGNLAKWLKNEGDQVKAGDVIAEIETDKATMEVEAVDEGILGKIIVKAGTENVPVNNLIALLLDNKEDPSILSTYVRSAPVTENVSTTTTNNQPSIEKEVFTQNKCLEEARVFASPLAKRIASQNNIDLQQIKGSGPGGRIIKKDIEEARIDHKVHNKRNIIEYTSIPNSNIRKIIAKKLTESKAQIPHFYLSLECNINDLLNARATLNSMSNQKCKLSVNDFVIKSAALALKEVPDANASWSETAILRYNNVDISVAVAIDGGLITPIIRNADNKSLSSISDEMKDLARKARENKLTPEEFQGGSFSISNLGMYGIKNFNAIINPPQSCILAIGSNSERVIVKNGQITTANIIDITLSCDHRVVDGAVGAKFLSAFKKYMENPILLF